MKTVSVQTSPIQREMLERTRELGATLVRLRYEGKASIQKNILRMRVILKELHRVFKQHLMAEDKKIFPFFTKHVPKVESLTEILSLEHEYLCDLIGQFDSDLSLIASQKNPLKRAKMIFEMQKRGLYLNYLLQGHIQVEVQNLYPTVHRLLTLPEKQELKKHIGCKHI